MNERERILDLVKKGVLSPEEALDLLEEIAKEKDETQIKKAAEKVSEEKRAQEDEDIKENSDAFDENRSEEKDAYEEDRQNFEDILEKLADEANIASSKLDEVNEEIEDLKVELRDNHEDLMELNTKEELDEFDEDDLQERQELEKEIQRLETKIDNLKERRTKLEAQLKSIRRDQWDHKKEKFNKKMDIPEDWKEQATDTINQMGGKMAEAGTELGRFFKKTFDTVADNMEWKDINFRVPGVATTKFEKTFEYSDVSATIIDVKLANGQTKFHVWDKPDLKVEAKIKLYGKMDEATPEEAFNQRSQIVVDEDHISFQIPNKRVACDLDFYLPSRVYDYISVKLLNGDIKVDGLDVKDIFLKSTNGDIDMKDLQATMLEVEGVNGDINVASGEIIDSIIETVNGEVTMMATPEHISISIVNGDIRLTLRKAQLARLEASSVNGNVKVALPKSLGLEGSAKTNLGSINSRLSDYEVLRQKKERMNQFLQFRRLEDQMAQIDLSTTTGNIYLKDSEE
ncbi:MAG TPA: daptomycin-sensing surface protein LiaX [Candidatus Tetragenococcus pullicola]|nr:daptomycin-sensing surface protein LiaX [Candidatus Tetragenococcus pullicola]